MAQDGGSPHTADFQTGAYLAPPSPLFNYPDFVWDRGEGFAASSSVDAGGVFGPTDPNAMQFSDIEPLQPWEDWPIDSQYLHFVGQFRPSGAPTQQQMPLTGSSFEIIVPRAFVDMPDPAKRDDVVLLIPTKETSDPERKADIPYAPNDYPGDPNQFGLWTPGWPGTSLMDEFRTSSDSFYLATGYIVPRTAFQPLVFSIERDRELREAMQLELNDLCSNPPQSIPPRSMPSNYATCICGSSFGGLSAMAAVMLWPDEFQSGVAAAFDASLRDTPDNQLMLDFLTGGVGLGASGSGYTLRSAVDWTIFAQLEGIDYPSLSLVNRMYPPSASQNPAPPGFGLLRPFALMVADEDVVAQGQDWMNVVNGTTGFAQPYFQQHTFTNLVTNETWRVDFFVLGKTCHGGDYPGLAEPFYLPGDPMNYYDINKVAALMIRKAYEQRLRVLPPLSLADRLRQKSDDLFTLNPNDIAFNRPRARTAPSIGNPPLLVEATDQQGWHRFGHGAWPGAEESMKVVKLNGQSRVSIFVGSADGIVTRYQMDPNVWPGHEPLVKQATSESLGWAVYGLDVGDVTGDGKPDVVAAAYRRIVVLDAKALGDTLVGPLQLDLPDWEDSEPQRIQIADVVSGNNMNEIVCRTLHGRILILGVSNGQLTILGEHSEAGVQDLAVGPAVPLQSDQVYSTGIWILSARSHLIGLDLDSTQGTTDIGRVAYSSTLQYGALADLEVYQGSKLALLAAGAPTEDHSIRIFEPPGDNNPTVTFGDVDQGQASNGDDINLTKFNVSSAGSPAAPSLAITAQNKFVTLYQDYVGVWDYGADVALGMKNLRAGDPPVARVAIGLAVGDIDGDGLDDVVISRADGRLMWFTIAELCAPGLEVPFTRAVQVDAVAGEVYDDRMNAAIAATWGFTAKGGTQPELDAIDVGGGWWVVDPLTGLPRINPPRTSYVLDTGIYGIRGLAYGGSGSSMLPVMTSGMSAGPDTYWQVDDGGATVGTSIRVNSTPYITIPDLGYWAHVPTEYGPPVNYNEGQLNWDDFWLFPMGGDAMYDGSDWRVAWWSTLFPNLAQQWRYSLQQPPTAGLPLLWSTTGTGNGTEPPGPMAVGMPAPTSGISLRTNLRAAGAMDLQTLRIGKVIPGSSESQVVVCGMGGRVIAIDGANGANGTIAAQSEDLGFGGMALALADLDGDGTDEIVFAPALAPVDAEPPDPPHQQQHSGWLRSYVHVLKYSTAGGYAHFDRFSTVPIGNPYDPTNYGDLCGYGACGLAVADLDGDDTPEVLVTTENGEFVVLRQSGGVFATPNGGMTQPTQPMFQTIVDGQLGAFNSIVVGDYDSRNLSKPEVYIASSTGIHKFYAQ